MPPLADVGEGNDPEEEGGWVCRNSAHFFLEKLVQKFFTNRHCFHAPHSYWSSGNLFCTVEVPFQKVEHKGLCLMFLIENSYLHACVVGSTEVSLFAKNLQESWQKHLQWLPAGNMEVKFPWELQDAIVVFELLQKSKPSPKQLQQRLLVTARNDSLELEMNLPHLKPMPQDRSLPKWRSIFARRSRGKQKNAEENLEKQSEQPATNKGKRTYTDPRAESPGRKRGRSAVFARSAVQNRYSLDGILTSKPHEIAEILYELGICKDIRENVCPKCEKKDWKLEDRENSCLVRCRKCRYSESVVAQDRDLFCKRIALGSAVGCLWLMCTLNLSPDQAGLILGLDSRTVREQWDAFRSWLCPLVEKMNEELTVGGPGMDVEIDEVAFRSAGLNTSVLWLRFIGMVRRGSSNLHRKAPLPLESRWSRWWRPSQFGRVALRHGHFNWKATLGVWQHLPHRFSKGVQAIGPARGALV